MGIPSYFSHIVKNYPSIIQKYFKNILLVDNLYLDCNSIIYDTYAKYDFGTNVFSESSIISSVIAKIEEYISTIEPKKNVIIAFDGVAPVAKLEQQRIRRYKSWYDNQTRRTIFDKKEPDVWNTTSITPGTIFMQHLNTRMRNHFSSRSEVIVSGSDIYGEGEHKIFDFIRQHPEKHKHEISVIYGLDADLIMLSLNHLPVSPNLYLFRETPHFIQSIDSSLEPDANYLMNIPELAKAIMLYLETDNINKMYDYIFICFFLGNDFMPHFPAVNIRTGGVEKMLQAYKASITPDEFITNGRSINWLMVRKLVDQLAKSEHEWLIQETKLRNRRENYNYPVDTPEQKYDKFVAIPTYERELEKYINPFKDYWQHRYYKVLLKTNYKDKDRVGQICQNYLEGLEWTMKYYSVGCPNWRWCYNYNYPPLLNDLLRYIPFGTEELVPTLPAKPVSQLVQLCYVLPRANLELLPTKLFQRLISEHPEWYKTNCEFVWAYCRYFWESHVEMEHIDIGTLEKFITDNRDLLT